jgi:hypothetical protein
MANVVLEKLGVALLRRSDPEGRYISLINGEDRNQNVIPSISALLLD